MNDPKRISFHCPVCSRINRASLESGGHSCVCWACVSWITIPRSTPSTFTEPKPEKERKPLFRGFAAGVVWGAVLAVLSAWLITKAHRPLEETVPSERPAAAAGE